jgi:hypothetical protein
MERKMLLLRLFVFPRLLNAFWQLLAMAAVMIISFIFKQYTVIPLILGVYFFLTFYTITSSNLVDNVEWLRNSLYTPKQLLFYYFIEQSIMMLMLLIPLASVVALLLSQPAIINELVSAKSTISGSGINPATAKQAIPILEKFQVSYSSVELALETIFSMFFMFSFFYGGGLIKTYFMHVKFEKKHSLEAKVFNGILFLSFTYIAVKDISAFMFLADYKVILFPLLLSTGMFVMFYAGNNGFKIFHDSSLKSPVVQVPLWTFFVLFTMSLGFSKLSYNMQGNYGAKLAELRFQGIFSSNVDQETIDRFYLSKIDNYNFKYLVRTYTPSDEINYKHVIKERTTLNQIEELWESMSEDHKMVTRYHVIEKVDEIAAKSPKVYARYAWRFIHSDEELSKYFNKNKKDFAYLAKMDQKKQESKRDVASENTSEKKNADDPVPESDSDQ